MTRFTLGLAAFLLMLAAPALIAAALAADNTNTRKAKPSKIETQHRMPPEIIEFKDARLKIEVNDTDGDAGIQAFIDVDLWEKVSIFDPDGNLLMRSVMKGGFADQGGTELFMESAEPDFSELPLEEFLERFPEGEYPFKGKTIDGERIVGSAVLTHNIPDGPVLVSPLEGDGLVNPDNAVVVWEPVGPANGSPIIGYEILVVEVDPDIPAIPKIALDIILPPSATSLTVPPEFLLPDTEYEWEVLAIEESGNQTLSAASFTTEP